MKFYRLVKSIWAQKKKANGDPNPEFKSEVRGPNVREGADFSEEFLQAQNELGYSIFFFPNRPDASPYEEDVHFLNGKMISNFKWIFADIDFKHGDYNNVKEVVDKLEQFPVAPTMVVFSGNGCHIYWKIEDLNRDAYVALQLKLIKHFKSDPAVFTVLQLMRMPGYQNTKKFNEPKPCQVLTKLSSGKSYSIKELWDVLPELNKTEKERGRNHLDRLDGKLTVKLTRDVNMDELPDRFLKLMQEKDHIAKLYDDPNARGDRSAADMTLSHFLYSEKFNYQEVLAVIANSQKGLEKGVSRMAYAKLTVDKVFDRRKTMTIQTVGEFLRDDTEESEEALVNGPWYLDSGVLGNPWRKHEILGLISGSGIGKTAFSLNIVLETIANNPDSDEVYVFVSLEMTKRQIIKRWIAMVGEDSKLADRLYVIDARGPDGMDLLMGLQEIYTLCEEIKQQTGRGIGILMIDYLHIISTHIDIRKTPNFGIMSEGDSGYGNIRNLTLNQTAAQLRGLTLMLDTFTIVLAQTTKAKGIGDTPLYKDASFGCSNFDWCCHRIATLFQPLLRVQSQTSLRALCFLYAKLRDLHDDDKIKIYDPKLLTYNMGSGLLSAMTPEEYQEFMTMLPIANEARAKALKQEPTSFSVVRKN